MRILAALSEKEASPSELAEEMGESLGVVSYHTRILLELKCIELVRKTPRRGAVEHHYRAIERPYFSDEDWAQLPAPVKASISQTTLSEIWRDVGNAVDSETFDSRDARHLAWMNLTLDDEGWAELNEALTSVIERAYEIQAESLERLEGEETATSKLVLMHFEAAPKRDASSGEKEKPSEG
jgi:DNA-binding transcriptional regulator GbsR (MarR family)